MFFKKKIRTRFAPSPTGMLHVGSLRTALYCYLFARNQKGQFILRIEDTDKSREVPGAVEHLITALHEFGLNYDEGPVLRDGALTSVGKKGPYIQSQRLDLYKKYALQLVNDNKAYYCFCTPDELTKMREDQVTHKQPTKYDKRCSRLTHDEVNTKMNQGIPAVIRLNINPGRTVTFFDLIRDDVSFSTDDLDDQVLLKSDGYPTYHLANVVDDHLMEISHVIRGEEWLPSAPKHILLFEAFGWKAPEYAHIPLLLSPDKKKLSKRQGDVAVEEFVSKGYLREALINFVALLGWNPGEASQQEVFTLDQLVKAFDIHRVHKSGAVFDVAKLDWINGLYIRALSLDQVIKLCKPFLRSAFPDASDDRIKAIVAVEHDRLKKLWDITATVDFYFNLPDYDRALLTWKKSTPEGAQQALSSVRELITAAPEPFSVKGLESLVMPWIKEKGLGNGDILWPLRVALTGKEQSPSPFEVAFVLGKQETLARIDRALEKLK